MALRLNSFLKFGVLLSTIGSTFTKEAFSIIGCFLGVFFLTEKEGLRAGMPG